jgi:hypothetical protein
MGGNKRWEARLGDTQKQMGFYGIQKQTLFRAKWGSSPDGQQKYWEKNTPYYYYQ